MKREKEGPMRVRDFRIVRADQGYWPACEEIIVSFP